MKSGSVPSSWLSFGWDTEGLLALLAEVNRRGIAPDDIEAVKVVYEQFKPVPWRIFLNRKYWGIINAISGEDAMRQVNERLGYSKAADTDIRAYRANSASD